MVVAATLVPAHNAARNAGPTTWHTLLALDVVVLAGAAVVVRDEKAWSRLAQEDGLIEWATVFAFGAAAVLLLRQVPRALRTNRLLAAATLCIGLFCLFVAGEEISWGQRLFAFMPPEAFLENNFQQELNVHNVLMDERGLGFKLESKHLVALIALLYGVAGPLLARIQRLAPAAPAFPPLAHAPVFLAVTALELSYGFHLAGEGAELLLGVCFVAGLVSRARAPRALIWLAAPFVIAAVLTPVLARVVFGSDAEGTMLARTELAQLARDVEAGIQPKLDTRRSIHKRVYTAARDGYLQIERGHFLESQASRVDPQQRGRADRKGYFLDPWNNPYWIYSSRGSGRVIVYSFGPNRQRDSEMTPKLIEGGDDVVVMVSRLDALPAASPATDDANPGDDE
jgi:hypothetical protein